MRRILCFLTRFIRRRRASAQVICEGLFFVSEASRPFRKQFFELWNDHGVDDHGAGGVELRDGFVEYLCDFAKIFRARLCIVAHRLAQDTDARSLQTFWVEKHGVAIRYITNTSGRKRVFRVVAYNDVQELCQIDNGTGHGAERSRNGRPTGINSTAAHKAGRWTHSDDRVPGRGAADRRKTFLSDSYRAEVRCDAGPGTTRGTSRRSLRIVRITSRAEKGAMGITAAELTQGGLCKNDCTSFFEFLNDKGVSIRIVVFQQNRAQRRRHPLGIGLIFNDDRTPVQCSDATCGLEGLIKTIRLFKSRGI